MFKYPQEIKGNIFKHKSSSNPWHNNSNTPIYNHLICQSKTLHELITLKVTQNVDVKFFSISDQTITQNYQVRQRSKPTPLKWSVRKTITDTHYLRFRIWAWILRNNVDFFSSMKMENSDSKKIETNQKHMKVNLTK